MQRTGGEFGTPSSLGETEAEFMFEDALDTLGDPRVGSVDLENAFIAIRQLQLQPAQSRKLLDTVSRSIDQWINNQWADKTGTLESISSTILPYLIPPSDDVQAQTELLPTTTAILGGLLAADPELYQRNWRRTVIKGRFGNPDEILTGLLSKVTSQEYLEEHDLDPVEDEYVGLVTSLLQDLKSQDNEVLIEKAKAGMSQEVMGALARAEMQKSIPDREILTTQAIIAMVAVDPDTFSEGLERRVLAGEYGEPEEILSGIIRSVSAKIDRSGYEVPDSPDSLTMAIVFDGLLTTSTERARELMPGVVESHWYWDRDHSFSYNALQAFDVAGVPVGEEERFVQEHARAIEEAFRPTLDHAALEQISDEGTFAQRFASVVRTIRENAGFFGEITLDVNPFDESNIYPYVPDNVLVAALKNPEGFAQLPAIEAVAPEIMRRLKDPAPLEERNSGMIRDMLATEKPLEKALETQAKLSKNKAKNNH